MDEVSPGRRSGQCARGWQGLKCRQYLQEGVGPGQCGSLAQPRHVTSLRSVTARELERGLGK